MTPIAYMVDQDTEGLRTAFGELLEEGFLRGKIERVAGPQDADPQRAAAEATRRDLQMERGRKARTLAAGYYTFAAHIFRLDAERNAGLPLDTHTLAGFEGSALRTLAVARSEYKSRHPNCSRCGAEQPGRFHPKCTECGADFSKKGSR